MVRRSSSYPPAQRNARVREPEFMFLRKCIVALWGKNGGEAMYGRDPVCELEAWALQQIAQMQKQIIEQEKQLQDLTQQQKCIADLVHGEKEVAELILEEQKIQDALRKKRLQHAQSLRNCGGCLGCNRHLPGLGRGSVR